MKIGFGLLRNKLKALSAANKAAVTQCPKSDEILYTEGDIRFAVATAKSEIERLTHQIEQIKGIESGEMADLRQYQREYNELRKVIDNGSESATHATALYKVIERENEIERLTAHDQFLADANKQWMADCERLTAAERCRTAQRDEAELMVKQLTAERDEVREALRVMLLQTPYKEGDGGHRYQACQMAQDALDHVPDAGKMVGQGEKK